MGQLKQRIFTTKQVKEVFGLSPKTNLIDAGTVKGHIKKVGRNAWIIRRDPSRVLNISNITSGGARVDFSAIDRKSGLRRREQLKARANALGFPYVSQFIYEWYCVLDKRPKEIAWELRVSYQSIYRWLAAWGFTPSSLKFVTNYAQAASFRGRLSYEPVNLQAVRHLWAAVMAQALEDISDGGKNAPGALAWISDTDEEECPSFIWVAELLKLDPEAVRKVVLHGG